MVGEREIHQRALPPKVASDGGEVDPNFFLGKLEGVGQEFPETEGHLVRGPDLDPTFLVNRHDSGVGLDIAVVGELRSESVLEDPVGFSESGLRITQAIAEDRLDVRVGSLG
jgi:hypothetical protein